ncbi:MAG: hypothetical protein M1582_02685, partial [Actinobacteria bacterium]|nr:hypothetical protein [Actinomycetota bacterium]
RGRRGEGETGRWGDEGTDTRPPGRLVRPYRSDWAATGGRTRRPAPTDWPRSWLRNQVQGLAGPAAVVSRGAVAKHLLATRDPSLPCGP